MAKLPVRIAIEPSLSDSEIAVKRLAQAQLPFEDTRPKRELAELQTLWDSKHPDRRGIAQGMEDWIAEDAIENVEDKEGRNEN